MHKKIISFLFVLLSGLFITAQESYDNCANPLEICPGETYTVNNIGATSTVCNNCEDDFNFCFTGTNSIWITFTTNEEGGPVQIDFSQLNFQNQPGQGTELQAAVISTTAPCIASSYNLVADCVDDASTDFSLLTDTLPGSTTFYIVVNGSMGTNASAEVEFQLQVHGPGADRVPSFGIWAYENTICKGNTLTVYPNLVDCDDASGVDWYLNDDFYKHTSDHFIVISDLEDGDVLQAKISCFEQCRDTLTSNTIVFTVKDFVVDAGPDKTIRRGESVKLEGYTDESIITWTPDYQINDNSLIQPVVQPEYTTIYTLTVSDGECEKSDEVTVFVDDDLVVPNTFSPNGDGINDTWDILGIEAYPDCHIQVFTRWGQLVFQSTGYNKDKRWDGTSASGRELAAGAYYYVINLRHPDYEKPLKGTVAIVK